MSKRFSTKKIIVIRRSTWSTVCLTAFLIAFLWLLQGYKDPPGTCISLEGLRNIRISSTEYPYFSCFFEIPPSTVFKDKKLFYSTASPVTGMPAYDHYTFIFLYEGPQQVLLHYSPTINKVYNNSHLLEPSRDLKEMLLELAASYRQETYMSYGSLLVWEEVDQIFPLDATARITDIYSGASFYVQRKEGVSHVDAQPLTAEDTAIMKKIYGGQWSWDRKGIIVEVQGYRIAASMNGMPHGDGIIEDNNFPGHFCIHFLGSIIHFGGMDIQHHQEILKAAGKLPKQDL